MSDAERGDERISAMLRDIHAITNGVYGYRRLAMELERRYGEQVGLKYVYCLAKLAGLQSSIRRKRKAYVRSTPEITAQNILARDLSAHDVNEKLLTDVPKFALADGTKLYLSAILERFDRSIVAYKSGRSNNSKLVFSTFDEAVAKYPDARPIFHSDRGFQYTNRAFTAKLAAQA